MAKIVIEIDGSRYEFDGEAEITQERGIKVEYDTHGEPTKMSPNGHSRIILKAWNGCKTFDSFIARS